MQYKLINKTTKEEIICTKVVIDGFKTGWQQREQQLIPIIKELGEALIKANLYVPPKFYGQGESVINDHYLEIQTTLEKYKKYL